MEKEISSKFLKITGEVELFEPLELGKEYEFKIKGDVFKEETEDDQAGGLQKCFKVRMYNLEAIDEKGKSIPARDKRRASQKLRNMIRFYQAEIGDERDEEEFYQTFMALLMANFEEVVNLKEIKFAFKR